MAAIARALSGLLGKLGGAGEDDHQLRLGLSTTCAHRIQLRTVSDDQHSASLNSERKKLCNLLELVGEHLLKPPLSMFPVN